MPTEQPNDTIIPCPPPLKILELDGANAAGAGHTQQNRLFSDDEESNHACDPLVEVPTDDDNMRTVTDIAAEAILAGSSEEQSAQAPQFVPVPSESVILALEKTVESDHLGSLLPEEQRDTVTSVHVDLQPLPDNPKVEKQPEEHLVDAWHALCDNVYTGSDLHKPQRTCPSPCSPSESPVLKQYHGICQSCFKAHIPFVPLPCHLQIHCLLGPAFNWERLGCQGFGSPFSLASCSSESNSCDIECDEAATAAVALILSEKLRDDHSQRSRLEAIPAVELYITPPQSPVFDKIDSCVSTDGTQSTLPCFIHNSPSPSPVCAETFSAAALAPVSTSPIRDQNPTYRPAFLSPLSERCPPQFISTPLGSPLAHTSPRDFPLNLVGSVYASPSSTHSDSDIHRNPSIPKLNSASFECSFPMDPVVSKVRPKVTKRKLPKSPARYRQQRFHSPLSERNGLNQLPVVRRPKLSAKSVARQEKKGATSFIDHRAKSNVRSVSRKRPVPSTDVIPDRFQEPRMAAKIARQSISLSVRALFSPSGMERCLEARNPLIFAAGLSHIPVTPDFNLSTPPTPSGRRTKSRSVCQNNFSPSESSIRKYGRTLFPEPIQSYHT